MDNKEIKKMVKESKSILITDKGILVNGFDPEEAIVKTLFSFLRMWDEHVCEIDSLEAGREIINLLDGFNESEGDEEDDEWKDMAKCLDYLLGGEDD